MEISKQLATRVLENLGFSVANIPEADSRRADLLVSDGEQSYAIETKDKYEGDALAAERAANLASSGTHDQEDLLAHDNAIKGIVRRARNQLDSTPKDAGTFQLIWFHSTGIDADTKFRQAFSTFYGDVHLIGMYPDNGKSISCFYFDFNAAFDMPTVEALILTDGKVLQFCINEFSYRATEFRTSKLFKTFSSLDAVFDPVALEANGTIMCCRLPVSRKNDIEICQAIKEATGILYNPIRLTRYSSSVAVRRPDSPLGSDNEPH